MAAEQAFEEQGMGTDTGKGRSFLRRKSYPRNYLGIQRAIAGQDLVVADLPYVVAVLGVEQVSQELVQEQEQALAYAASQLFRHSPLVAE